MSVNDTVKSLIEQLDNRLTVSRLDGLFECCRLMDADGDKKAAHRLNIDTVRRFAARGKEDQSKSFDARMKYLEIYRKSVFFSAPEDVDSFWIALEWGREYKKAFYLPRRKQLLPIIHGYQEMLDDKIDVLTISQPTGTGKSTLMIGFNCLLAGRDPDKSKFMTAYGDGLCQSFYKGMLTFMQDEEYNYHEIFPNIQAINTNAKKYEIDINKSGRYPTLSAASIDAGFVGRTRAQELITMDDMVEDLMEAMNENRLESLWSKVSVDLFGRMEGACKILCQGTRYSIRDVIGHVQDAFEGKRIRIIEVPGLNENDESNFEFDCENKYSTEWYLHRKEMMDDAEFMTTVQQIPVERDGLLFTESELKYYSDLPVDLSPDTIVAVCDTATDGTDFLVMPVVKVYGDEYYLEDVVFTDEKTDVSKPMCAAIILNNSVMRCQFESNAAGTVIADDVRDMVKAKGGICQFTKKPTVSNKAARIWGSYDNIKQHVYFKDKSLYSPKSPYGRFMKALFQYSAKGKNKHDDVPDALSLLIEFLQGTPKAEVKVLRRTF